MNSGTSHPRATGLTGYTVIGEKPDSFAANLAELWRFRTLVRELVLREMKIRYKNRVGGIIWSLFSPIMQVVSITVMVKLFLAKVDNYSAYLMGVMFLWQFFQNTMLDAGNSIMANAGLARKVYFPRAILPLVSMLVNFIHFCISLGFTLVYFFALRTYPEHLTWKIILIFPISLGVGLLGLGIGFLTARLNTLYEDVRFLSQTIIGLCFYAVPIFYPVEKVALAMNGKLYSYYMLNPMAAYMVAFQRALLPPLATLDGKPVTNPIDIPWPFLLIAAATTVVLLVLGAYTFERSKWAIMERL